MSVSAKIPQVSSLKAEVEKIAGISLKTHNAFLSLVAIIESSLSEHMSESTLERLWGYSTRSSETVSVRTLDVLSKFVGAGNWDNFCKILKEELPNESEEIIGECINASNLKTGSELVLGWLPNRKIRIKYLGDHKFEVLESENSSLRAGDRFECLTFQKGRELYLDHFVREGTDTSSRYVVGQRAGLTLLSIAE